MILKSEGDDDNDEVHFGYGVVKDYVDDVDDISDDIGDDTVDDVKDIVDDVNDVNTTPLVDDVDDVYVDCHGQINDVIDEPSMSRRWRL